MLLTQKAFIQRKLQVTLSFVRINKTLHLYILYVSIVFFVRNLTT